MYSLSYLSSYSMVNLSKVTHTCVCGTPNEKVTSTIGSVVETSIDASTDIEGLISKHNTCKHHIITYIKNTQKTTHTHTHIKSMRNIDMIKILN